MRLIWQLGLLLASLSATGAQWYAAPTSVGGNGSLTNPWALSIALTNYGSITAGDTLYLRGGVYAGPGFNSDLSGTVGNPVTIRSYPGEWAIIADGRVGTLATELSGSDATNQTIKISGSELWDLNNLWIENETLYVASRSGTNWTVIQGWGGTTPKSHSIGTAVYIQSALFNQNSNYVILRDMEFTCYGATNRTSGTNGHYFPAGINFNSTGVGNRAIGLIVHNTGHPGIGFWKQGAGAEINGCLIWGIGTYFYNNDYPPGTIGGSAVYAQNDGGMAKVANCINFRTFTGGGKVFGETGPVRDFRFDSNIVFGTPLAPLSMNSGSSASSNIWMVGNIMMGSPSLSYNSHNNTREFFAGNTVVDGAFGVSEHTNSYYTNNVVFMPKNEANGTTIFSYHSDHFNKSALGIVWDYNTIYLGNGSGRFQWTYGTADITALNSGSGGLLAFNNDEGKSWQDWSGFDANSTFATNWPTDYLSVTANQLDYDSNRWHVCVVNTTAGTNATLNLASLGFSGGRYQLRDAQNYFSVIASGVGGGTINLPLNLTNVAEIPGVTNFVNKHSNVDNPGLFNVFLLDRLADGGSISATTLRAGTLILK